MGWEPPRKKLKTRLVHIYCARSDRSRGWSQPRQHPGSTYVLHKTREMADAAAYMLPMSSCYVNGNFTPLQWQLGKPL
eukprot:scaffold156747_cov32-Prasinocladus_malaysianus.AAC.1